jgi:hypothetical protein
MLDRVWNGERNILATFAFNFSGDRRVNNSGRPRASPKSARYQLVRVGINGGSKASWRNVIMFRF